MTTSTLSSKGQITLPKDIRDRLNLHVGDRLDFAVEEDGSIRIVPLTTSVRDLKGMVPPPGRPLGLEEMDEAIASGIRKR